MAVEAGAGHAKQVECGVVVLRGGPVLRVRGSGGGNAASHSAIGAARLRTLLPFDVRSINQLVLLGPYPIDSVGTLIFRRASRLDAFSGYPCRTSATQRCPWRDNWYTGGPSVPVLSY